jgi:D-threo-aldose 1-dehydrogenase
MDPFLRRPIGSTPLQVTQLGFGGASLGDMRESIVEAQASATIEAAHAAGIGYFDTSPWYGNGKSELRFGQVLRSKPRDSFVISTKVGRVHRRPPDPTATSILPGPAVCRSNRASTIPATASSRAMR